MERSDIILMGSRNFKQITGFGDWGWTDQRIRRICGHIYN